MTSVYETRLQSIVDPVSSTGHVLHTRYKKDVAADVVNLQVDLVQAASVLVTRTFSGISSSFVTDDYTLSGGEADSITDYGNLRIRFTATSSSSDPAKVQDAASLNGTTATTTFDHVLTGLTVGNVLIIRTAADNAGSSGAAATVTVSNQSGTAINAAGAQQFQANADPGAASAGITCNVIVATITATSGTVRLTYSTSLRQSSVAEEWSGLTGAVVGTPVTATNAATGQPSVTDASVASGNLAYVAIAAEGPSTDTYTADTDTTNGSWVTGTKVGQNSGTATNDTTTTSAWKVTTGTGAQAWDNATHTNTRDTAGIIVELTRAAASARAVVSWAQFETPAAGTAVSGSDTAAGSDAVTRIALSSADTGAGTEAAAIAATLSTTETGTGTDAVTRIGVTTADTGAGTDAAAAIALSTTETGAGTDTSTAVALATTETGAATDAVSRIGTSTTETGTGSDTGTLIGTAAAETGTATDTNGGITLATTETAAGTEAAALAATLSTTETGAGADTATTVALSTADTGLGTEASSIGIVISSADTGAGSDTATRVALSGVADTATGTETAAIAATLTNAETAAATDTATRIGITAADTGGDTETGTISLSISSSDTATGTEASSLVASFTTADTGAGTETAAVAAALTNPDTAAGTDDAETLAALVAAADTAAATELAALGLSDFDTAAGSEGNVVNVITTIPNVPGCVDLSLSDLGSVTLAVADILADTVALSLSEGSVSVSVNNC